MDTTHTETQTPVITLTDAAIKEVKRLINVQGITEGGLRLGVKGGGCSGLSYTFAWERQARLGDHVFQGPDGAQIFVDKKSLLFLNGTVLDYDTSLDLPPINDNRDRASLTDQERQCLELMAEGYSTPRIARALDLKHEEARALEADIILKFHANNRFQAIAKAVLHGIVQA